MEKDERPGRDDGDAGVREYGHHPSAVPGGVCSFSREGFVNEIAGARSDVLRQIAERARQFKTNIYTLSNLYYNDGRFLDGG